MLMQFKLDGKYQGWVNTGFVVRKGEWVHITAGGVISFAFGGWNRGPDGKDEHQQIEYPASKWDSNGSYHPAGQYIKNSLVVRIGQQLVQCGRDAMFRSNYDGVIEVTNNDNQTHDNGGAWNLTIMHGMFQKHLFVLQGMPNQKFQELVEKDVERFIGTVYQQTDGQLTIKPTYAYIPQAVVESEHEGYPPDLGYVARYDGILKGLLEKQGKPVTNYHGTTRIYMAIPTRPRCGSKNCFKGNTYISHLDYLDKNQRSPPGVTVIPIEGSTNQPGLLANGLWETMVHEFQHMLSHRFDWVGIKNYGDPDNWGGAGNPITAPNVIDYYYRMMKVLKDLTPVPYYKLNGLFGDFTP